MSDWEDDWDGDDALTLGERRAPASLSVGLVAMLPLLAAYEWSVHAADSSLHNTAELLVSLPLSPLGNLTDIARLAALAIALGASLVLVRKREWELGRSALRVVGEGLAAGIALGPLLLAVTSLVGLSLPSIGLGSSPVGAASPAARTAFVFGGAAYEELVFRVGAYGLFFLVARRFTLALGSAPRFARVAAEAAALLLSAALFATFHLRGAVAFLGAGGEPFHAGLFVWRFMAGLLLGVLFRWRGPGVAGWAHGLFNASLVLGAGPGVLE